MDSVAPKKDSPKEKPSEDWERKNKSIPKPLRTWRTITWLTVILVVGVLAVWGYLSFSLLSSSYQEANNPTVEQVETYRLRVDEDAFFDTISELDSRNLY